MGHYVSVRGWIEVEPEKLARVKHLLLEFPNTSGEGVLTPEQVRLGLDHGVGHFRPLSITRQRHLLAYHGIAMSCEGLCQWF